MKAPVDSARGRPEDAELRPFAPSIRIHTRALWGCRLFRQEASLRRGAAGQSEPRRTRPGWAVVLTSIKGAALSSLVSLRALYRRLRLASALTAACLLALSSFGPALAQQAKRPGTVQSSGPVDVTRSATLQIKIESDAAHIFEYLSDATKLSLWFPDQAVFEPQIGGRYHFRWKETAGLWSGVVIDFVRGSTLAFTWRPPDEPYETKVRFRLIPQSSETVVELTHSGFTSSGSLDKAIEAWRFYLQNLKSVMEEATDLRGRSNKRRSPAPVRPRRHRKAKA